MQDLPPGVRPGRLVRARGEVWVVVSATPFEGCALVTLEGRDRLNHGRRSRLLTPFDALTDAPRTERPRRRPRAALRNAVLGSIARQRAPGRLWTLIGGRFDLWPWQLEPALAVLDGTTRLLLADAVGMGKTVQAGLIVAELMARGWAARTLILTPPGLRHTWAAEFAERFGLTATILGHDERWRQTRAPGDGSDPWMGGPIVVSSIDLVKRAEIRAAVEYRPLDVLVVDEAHHLTPGTDRGILVERLARCVPWVVLASATPHTGERAAFRFLLDLGRTGAGEPRMRVFRRSRADAGITRMRRSLVLRVPPTPAEQVLLESVRRYAAAIVHGPHQHRAGLRLVGAVMARRATSSALAIERTLQRRLALLSRQPSTAEPRQGELPWVDTESEDETPADEWMGTAGLADERDECRWLQALLGMAADAARCGPSKLACLERLLRRAREPAIVFTEFRDSLEACFPVAERLARTVCLHGGMNGEARARAVDDFTAGRAPVLLATDVAGEGLNLHARCRLVIMLEWPWSPQRIEQRIGRVDRLGQAGRVHAVHLTGRRTFEESVVAHVLRRRARASQDLDLLPSGTGGPSEREVERAVFDTGAAAAPLPAGPAREQRARPRRAPDPRAVQAAADARTGRRLARLAGKGDARAGWAFAGRRTGATRVAVVFEAIVRGVPGRLDACTVVPVNVELARRPGTRREWRDLCRALGTDPRIRRLAAGAAPAGAPPPGIAQRLSALLEALPGLRRGPGVQGALFDRRAIRHAAQQQEAVTRLAEHLRRQAARLGPATTSATTELRLLAVLPLP